MADEDAQLRVDALREAFAQAGSGIEGVSENAKLEELASAAPIVRLVEAVLREAVARRASDVHIEGFEREVSIRFRIDGRCFLVAKPPHSIAMAIASRIKVLANLDVAESRLPQDGRILFPVEGGQVDLRVSTLPTIHGESIVLRVLDKGALNTDLSTLGMTEVLQQQLGELLERSHGLLLVTGPTGCGKTTTLYAYLTKYNTPEVKIITTEDPVEYDVPGIVQIGVNEKIKLNFATCLRAILRHDPDVVMVGEIRDQETAQVAIQAALTGHLVFSTLHTNDAPGAVTRLLDMGIEPFLVSSTVSGVLAQRLVRLLCTDCRQPYDATPDDLSVLGVGPGGLQQPLMRSVGCEACQGIGYRGRVGLYELLIVNEALQQLIIDRASVDQVREKSRAEGLRTLREDGIVKVLAGVTTVSELLKETQDYA